MSDSTILKVSNLARGVTRMEVRDIFKGIKLNADDIFFSRRDLTSPTTVAYIVINDQEEASKAMFRSGRYLSGQQISIVLSNLAAMNRDTTDLREKISEPAKPPSRPPVPRGERDRSFHRDSPRNRPRPYDRPMATPISRLGSSPQVPVDPFDHPKSSPGAAPRAPPPPDRSFHRPRGPNVERDVIPTRFLMLTGIPYSSTELEIQNFFEGILTRRIVLIKNKFGRYIGQSCGEALLEFFNETDTQSGLAKHGGKFGHRVAYLKPIPATEAQTIVEGEESFQNRSPKIVENEIQSQPVLENSVPQLQNLLAIIGSLTNPQVPRTAENPKPYRRSPPKRENLSDPVSMRVAHSANVNQEDIRGKRVVGIRNLPYTVTTHEILDLFRGFMAIPQSVRIHYLDDGKSSGDALVSFRSHTDAKNAVNALNRRPVGHRKVDLFVL